jgi:hypothetical protein
MYVDTCKSGKYVRHLLRESYREGGKVRHRTIANISHCSGEEIKAVKWALKHKKQLDEILERSGEPVGPEQVSLRQEASFGAVWLLAETARRLGIAKALGDSRQGKLALWQVIARVLDQGSRLSAVRLAEERAVCDILGLEEGFSEDHLYGNLDWLSENQPRIEDRLFAKLHPDKDPGLYLYDVTSSYLEGSQNELAAFGYNRDKKSGKRQIVIGLLCDGKGRPLSVEVFPGNTRDPATVAAQISKIAERFGGGEVTMVGDRGMLKSRETRDLLDCGFHYITAITKPQINSLLKKGVFQMSLFDQELAEVQAEPDRRYILRRNPVRAREIESTRRSKLASLRAATEKLNIYLKEHPRASVEVALRKLRQRCAKLKLDGWTEPVSEGRKLELSIAEAALREASNLDGCYVITTDLDAGLADKQPVHDRYKDLAQVEWAFRTSKTAMLEMRPLHVRKEKRTRGHALVVMLAYRIVQDLADRWGGLDLTVEEGLGKLDTFCAMEASLDGSHWVHCIPEPRADLRELLDLAGVSLPEVLPNRRIRVSTRRKLPMRRKTR